MVAVDRSDVVADGSGALPGTGEHPARPAATTKTAAAVAMSARTMPTLATARAALLGTFGPGTAAAVPNTVTPVRAWVFCVLIAVAVHAPGVVPAAAAPGDPPVDDINRFPLAEGDYTRSYFSWVHFTTPDGRSCGMAPNGGPTGCDAVPADAPPGVNQTYVDAAHPATYRHSDTATFTDVSPVLPSGRRVQTLGAACAVDYDGAVHCQTEGNHGFILSTETGVLW